ncbi:MAG TPA: hypothetical protein PLZ75_02140 [Bacteroidales bacterium]|jgi:hypothetical protein|nr:hypothetical protein [Bacteroidales bacterium]HQH24343.1 hypothetical protein [Bacteroidales bacterium]HQJ81578.1 hypothetical protein [Bacteroidales bacterium]
MKNSLGIILLCLAMPFNAGSQQIGFRTGLYSFFDNTEFGHSRVHIPQTMAGVRFVPGMSVSFDSVHTIVAGVNMLHEYGSTGIIDDLSPVAYYMFRKSGFSFLAGAFPREEALDRFPRLFFRDSISFYRPNMNGILLDYSGRNISANLWLDWTSRQSYESRETFFVGFSGKYNREHFYIRNFSYMFHFAGFMDPVTDEPLHDNLLQLTSAGLDLSGVTFLSRLDFNVGYVTGFDRARALKTGWLLHHGFLSELNIEYRGIGIFNTFYAGDGQMEYYPVHNNELYWGDPFYRTNTYNRTDFYWSFLRSNIIKARLEFSFHFTEGNIYNEQALKVSVNLNNIRMKN